MTTKDTLDTTNIINELKLGCEQPAIKSMRNRIRQHILKLRRKIINRKLPYVSKLASRHEFQTVITNIAQDILEIGVFDRPLFDSNKVNVQYADYLSTKELQDRASRIPGHHPKNVPSIDYQLSKGYKQITKKFDIISSSHCLEHVPDLVQHLLDIGCLLKKGGALTLIIPDKSACFDYFMPESVITEVIAAHLEKRTKPTLRSVIEHRAYIVNFPVPNSTQNPYTHHTNEVRERIDQAYNEHNTMDYVDVHCWYFSENA